MLINQNLEAQLAFAIEAAEPGTWDLNPATGTFIGNNRLKEWFELDTLNPSFVY